MSLSYSINNAMTGLSATSKAAEVVSNNVANAMTEGYARREVQLSAKAFGSQGAGVSVDGVKRVVDEAVLRDRRLADAAVGKSSVTAEFYGALERLIGTPEDGESLTANVDALGKSLLEAASRPDNLARLQAVTDSATALAGHLNRASEGVQRLRMDAEDEIAMQVQTMNASLKQVADLNNQIAAAAQSKQDASALLDLRQQEIDKLSSIVPLRVVPRDDGRVSVFTMNGARLVDGTVAKIEFQAKRLITPQMSLAGGTLNGVVIDGREEAIDGPNSPFAGGSLGALFELRDSLAVEAQTQLDAVARDLIDRFADPAVDSTLAANDPGLFTDFGVAFDATIPENEQGLAGRITVNPTVVPSEGGELWKLRDGLNAAAEGDVGDGARLQALADALTARRTPASAVLPPNRGANGMAEFVLSGVGVARGSSETALAGATSQQTALSSMQAADGVDTDAELQKLMLIEQSYAANARVISVADQLMKMLLEL